MLSLAVKVVNVDDVDEDHVQSSAATLHGVHSHDDQ